jgi:hypothetical protein
MSDQTTLTARIIPPLAVLALTVACTACTVLRPAVQQPAAATRPAPSPAPAHTTTAAAPGLATLLPASPAWTGDAAGLAARFAAAYATWSWRQPPAAHPARLRPMTATQLYPTLAQAADTASIPGGRDRGHLAAAGTVTGERIRDLTPGSVIITVQARQVTTSADGGCSEVPDDLAITVVRAGGSQAVWDAEPAADGNTGTDAADALTP